MIKKNKFTIKTIIVAIILIQILTVVGCGDVVIFKEKDTGELQGVSNDNLEEDTYYVKQGTKFFPVYSSIQGSAKGESLKTDQSRVITLCGEELKVPNCYKGEVLAYYSTKKYPDILHIERFKDLQYGLGVYGGFLDSSGYLFVNTSQNINKNCYLYALLKDEPSKDLRIMTVNNKPVSESMDYRSGVLYGFEKGEEVEVEYLIGTVYHKARLIADTRILQSFEYFNLDPSYISYSTNGYISFNMPSDLKSGFYVINGAGVYLYFDKTREEVTNDTSLNDSYYETERASIEANSKQYSATITQRLKEAIFIVTYEKRGSVDTREIEGYIYTPSGEQIKMELDEENNLIYQGFTEVEIGEWQVNILPKDLPVKEFNIESIKFEEEATLKETSFVIDDVYTNVLFTAYTKESEENEVFGYVLAPDGRSYDMIYDFNDKEKEGVLYVEIPRIEEGTYIVKTYYHPTTTEISDAQMVTDPITDTDTIIIAN